MRRKIAAISCMMMAVMVVVVGLTGCGKKHESITDQQMLLFSDAIYALQPSDHNMTTIIETMDDELAAARAADRIVPVVPVEAMLGDWVILDSEVDTKLVLDAINKDWNYADWFAKFGVELKDKIEVKVIDKGFAAAAFYHPESGEVVIAFRGSGNVDVNDIQETDFDDWLLNDVRILLGVTPPQSDKAIAFVKRILQGIEDHRYDKNGMVVDPDRVQLSLTGHSLGGYLAQYTGREFVKGSLREDHAYLKKVVTFNAPGFWNPNREELMPVLAEELKRSDFAEELAALIGDSVDSQLLSWLIKYKSADLIDQIGVYLVEQVSKLITLQSPLSAEEWNALKDRNDQTYANFTSYVVRGDLVGDNGGFLRDDLKRLGTGVMIEPTEVGGEMNKHSLMNFYIGWEKS